MSDVADQTWLSEREAELYEYHWVKGKKLTQAASEMGLDASSCRTMKTRINSKREKSENTLELFEGVDTE